MKIVIYPAGLVLAAAIGALAAMRIARAVDELAHQYERSR
jgi:hypothetical protein